eukprot:jgi/Orpsp1_1/1191319/evm.model.d7180000084934.1
MGRMPNTMNQQNLPPPSMMNTNDMNMNFPNNYIMDRNQPIDTSRISIPSLVATPSSAPTNPSNSCTTCPLMTSDTLSIHDSSMVYPAPLSTTALLDRDPRHQFPSTMGNVVLMKHTNSNETLINPLPSRRNSHSLSTLDTHGYPTMNNMHAIGGGDTGAVTGINGIERGGPCSLPGINGLGGGEKDGRGRIPMGGIRENEGGEGRVVPFRCMEEGTTKDRRIGGLSRLSGEVDDQGLGLKRLNRAMGEKDGGIPEAIGENERLSLTGLNNLPENERLPMTGLNNLPENERLPMTGLNNLPENERLPMTRLNNLPEGERVTRLTKILEESSFLRIRSTRDHTMATTTAIHSMNTMRSNDSFSNMNSMGEGSSITLVESGSYANTMDSYGGEYSSTMSKMTDLGECTRSMPSLHGLEEYGHAMIPGNGRKMGGDFSHSSGSGNGSGSCIGCGNGNGSCVGCSNGCGSSSCGGGCSGCGCGSSSSSSNINNSTNINISNNNNNNNNNTGGGSSSSSMSTTIPGIQPPMTTNIHIRGGHCDSPCTSQTIPMYPTSHEVMSLYHKISGLDGKAMLNILEDRSQEEVEQLLQFDPSLLDRLRDQFLSAAFRNKKRPAGSNEIPRPLNAFMIYRRHMIEQLNPYHMKVKYNDMHTDIAKYWHQEPQEVKDQYKKKSIIHGLIHSR